MNNIKEKASGIKNIDVTGFMLKLIAIITMTADHIGAIIFEDLAEKQQTSALWTVEMTLRGVGRLAFPLFCFFLTEGFHYTHNRKKYALRLTIFAVISEVPFDISLNGKLFYPEDNNVMWTLLLGLLSIWALDELFKKTDNSESLTAAASKSDINVFNVVNILKVIEVIAVALAADLTEEFLLNSDYGFYGVAAVMIMYIFRSHRLIGFSLAVIWLGLSCGGVELYALADLIPLYFYHGRQGKKMKYFFYVYYPAHLLIIRLAAFAAGLY